MSATTTPKFVLLDGQLTIYALACGYIQRATVDGEKIGNTEGVNKTHVDLNMESSCCYDVSAYIYKNGDIFPSERDIQSFDRISEARKHYKKMVKKLKLISCRNG